MQRRPSLQTFTLLFFMAVTAGGGATWGVLWWNAEMAYKATIHHICYESKSINCRPETVNERLIKHAVNVTHTTTLRNQAKEAKLTELKKPFSLYRRIKLYDKILDDEAEKVPVEPKPTFVPLAQRRTIA